jgi:hypothetical protein
MVAASSPVQTASIKGSTSFYYFLVENFYFPIFTDEFRVVNQPIELDPES